MQPLFEGLLTLFCSLFHRCGMIHFSFLKIHLIYFNRLKPVYIFLIFSFIKILLLPIVSSAYSFPHPNYWLKMLTRIGPWGILLNSSIKVNRCLWVPNHPTDHLLILILLFCKGEFKQDFWRLCWGPGTLCLQHSLDLPTLWNNRLTICQANLCWILLMLTIRFTPM